MQTVYIGNNLVNDVMLGSQRMDDVIENPNLYIDWLLIGGGASGGTFGNQTGGSGGAGRFVSSSMNIQPQSISITIGNGGAGVTYTGAGDQGNDGGQSSIIISGTTYTAPGGGGGGGGLNTPNATRNGRSGGSGGGGASTSTGGSSTGGSNIAGSPIAGFGNNGQSKGSLSPGAGLGGGAGGTPTGYPWLDGVTYAGGGGSGLSTAGSGTVGQTVNNSSATAQNGIAVIRYYGTPKATGGAISESGGYTYHYFYTSGTLSY